MKRIIVEGVDGSGKSTVISMLQERVKGVRLVDGFMRSGVEDYETWLRRELVQETELVPIHDRFFYSELVYGPILRQRLSISPSVYEAVLPRLRREAFLIYCRPSLSTLLKSAQVNPQMAGVLDNLENLYAEYDLTMMQEWEHYGKRFIEWDFTRHHFINYLGPKVRAYVNG